jgi:hypothetical protein
MGPHRGFWYELISTEVYDANKFPTEILLIVGFWYELISTEVYDANKFPTEILLIVVFDTNRSSPEIFLIWMSSPTELFINKEFLIWIDPSPQSFLLIRMFLIWIDPPRGFWYEWLPNSFLISSFWYEPIFTGLWYEWIPTESFVNSRFLIRIDPPRGFWYEWIPHRDFINKWVLLWESIHTEIYDIKGPHRIW